MTIASTIPLADTWGMHGDDVGAGWMIVMVLFWGAIILGIVWLIRGSGRHWAVPAESRIPTESPLEILERRFAEGAISIEDFKARRKALTEGSAQANGPDDAPPATPEVDGRQ